MNTAPETRLQSFALLDDHSATAEAPRSRLYTHHVRTLTCAHPQDLAAMLAHMQQALQDGLHAVVLLHYELGAQFHGLVPVQADPARLGQILLFQQCACLSAEQALSWLEQRRAANHLLFPEATVPDTDADAARWQDQNCAGVAALAATIDATAFAHAIDQIHAYQQAGDTYQVNYTYRLRFTTYGPLLALYCKLRARQPVPYGALIVLPDGQAVLSFSPELFLRHVDGQLTTRPMKGTAPASGDAVIDQQQAAVLAGDIKNRAENLMIVDLLRNDLSQIASVGSVRVPRLFEVHPYGNVLQMTSTVEASLLAGTSLAAVFAALFPCGSITGAPKRRTMHIIDALETAPRGLYTGAIGWFGQPGAHGQIGNFCLSVPIRTLVLDTARPDGTRQGEMGVGAGIVYDSTAVSEYAECQLKASFLTAAPADFSLFETLFATREEGYRHLELHLQRLRESARYFNFTHDDAAVHSALASARLTLPAGVACRVRLDLYHNGRVALHSAALAALPAVVRMLLAPEPVRCARMLLGHKISQRAQYDRAWRAAEAQGSFDMLFSNAEGELTEGARSNLFLLCQGHWYTPPLSAGVLPGVMRSILLADPRWQAREQRLTLSDLRTAEKIVLCNSLRGVMPAQVVWPCPESRASETEG